MIDAKPVRMLDTGQKTVLKQFLPRFNRRFQVPARCPDPAFRPLPPELCLEQVLCFKNRRLVAKDNTVKFQRHILQLLPGQKRRTYAGAVVAVLQGLDGRLSLQHEGRIIAAQERPPGPGVLCNGSGTSSIVSILTPDPELSSEPSPTVLELPNTGTDQEDGHGVAIGDVDVAELQVTASPRHPTFLQKERWKTVQRAKLAGLSIRGMARELGIHRDTVRRYVDAESQPTGRPRATPATLPSDTISIVDC